jgi:hypothetical protein
MNATRKALLIAAALIAPTASALAATDAFEGYNRGIAGLTAPSAHPGAQGPAGPSLATDMACGRDPFEGYRRGLNGDGPSQLCGAAMTEQPGARGPAGPAMASAWSDPFQGYRRGISAE